MSMCALRPGNGRRSRYGLETGEIVVTAGVQALHPGQKVRLLGPSMMGFNLSEWALRHRSLIVYLMIVAVVAGLASYFRLGRDEDPAFIIKTMVVQAAWPGATVEETLKQVTERLERKLQETPQLDFLRSFTTRGRHHNLRQSEGHRPPPRRCPTSGIMSARASATSAHTLPAGVVGPGFNDDFGDTFGMIYGFTADGFTHRELRDYVEDDPLEAAACRRRLEDRDSRRAGRADLRRVLQQGTREPRHRPRGADRRAAGAERRQPAGAIQTGDEKLLAARLRRVPVRSRTCATSISSSAAACSA